MCLVNQKVPEGSSPKSKQWSWASKLQISMKKRNPQAKFQFGDEYQAEWLFEQLNCCKTPPRKRRALETSCSADEHANAKLKACDSGVFINDVIALDDDDHRSSNANFHQLSSSRLQIINHISPPKTETLNKSQSPY
ncbi:hypothetical protein PGT21_012436 [Puccinia graminis f. sp. tritici]|uniref:Uncharacterized protein n=1 Tax=Puccinia graminis f. sp. tritici TaxID=56615 RepID=A0A5B0PXF5_PUCGR|nr:hypothetical protein PGT21_012436 [Puccinia graminis f. sp. tritici]